MESKHFEISSRQAPVMAPSLTFSSQSSITRWRLVCVECLFKRADWSIEIKLCSSNKINNLINTIPILCGYTYTTKVVTLPEFHKQKHLLMLIPCWVCHGVSWKYNTAMLHDPMSHYWFCQIANSMCRESSMGLLPHTQNCGLRMCRECRKHFPSHRLLAIPKCITARAWRTCPDACRGR